MQVSQQAVNHMYEESRFDPKFPRYRMFIQQAQDGTQNHALPAGPSEPHNLVFSFPPVTAPLRSAPLQLGPSPFGPHPPTFAPPLYMPPPPILTYHQLLHFASSFPRFSGETYYVVQTSEERDVEEEGAGDEPFESEEGFPLATRPASATGQEGGGPAGPPRWTIEPTSFDGARNGNPNAASARGPARTMATAVTPKLRVPGALTNSHERTAPGMLPLTMWRNRRKTATKIKPSTLTGAIRQCAHCGTQKTPQWRSGPEDWGEDCGSALCNTCGVRFRNGRLKPVRNFTVWAAHGSSAAAKRAARKAQGPSKAKGGKGVQGGKGAPGVAGAVGPAARAGAGAYESEGPEEEEGPGEEGAVHVPRESYRETASPTGQASPVQEDDREAQA